MVAQCVSQVETNKGHTWLGMSSVRESSTVDIQSQTRTRPERLHSAYDKRLTLLEPTELALLPSAWLANTQRGQWYETE